MMLCAVPWILLGTALISTGQQVPHPGLSYWYPGLYAGLGTGGGYSAPAVSAISTPYQYEYAQNQYPAAAYSYPCYNGPYPDPYPYPYPYPEPPLPTTTTTRTPTPTPAPPFTIFSRHSLSVDGTHCPQGTQTLWAGFSFSQVAYGENQDGPGVDLGSYKSCYRDIASLIPYLRRNYTSYWLNSDVYPEPDPVSKSIGRRGVHGGNTSPVSYDMTPYISRCTVCQVRAQVTTIHSLTDDTPLCPAGWYRMWNGFSYAQGQTDPYTSKEAYDKALVSPGSCLEKFKAKPLIRCPGQGHCASFSSAYGYWIPAAGTRHTISKCIVCTTHPIGKPDPYIGIPTTVRSTTTTTTRRPWTTTTTTEKWTTTTTTTKKPIVTTPTTTPSTTTTSPTTNTTPSTTTTPTTTPTTTTTASTTTPTTTTTTTTEDPGPGSSTSDDYVLPDIPDIGENVGTEAPIV